MAEATRLQQESLDTIRNPDPATALKAARIRERAFQSVQAESAHGMLGGTDEARELAELRAMRSRIHGVMAETLRDLEEGNNYPASREAIQAVFDETRVSHARDGAAVIALERGTRRRGAKKRGRP